MYISKVRIKNFANFQDLEVDTCESLVIVGENKIGKSNFVFALQLLLDPSLSERDRQLGVEHFWDGLGASKLGHKIEISVELTGFESNNDLIAHLVDCLVATEPMVARLTYRFQPKAQLDGEPQSICDYEYLVFGGEDADKAVPPALRRMLPMDVLGALRDAEKELGTWRRSPLRPLVEAMAIQLDETASQSIIGAVNTAQSELVQNQHVQTLATTISNRLHEIVGPQHATQVGIGLSPTGIDALLRSLRLLIDGGGRSIEEASLGTANLLYLALKSLELDRLVAEGERNHTFLVVEEPEAHLHPHVQRLVYRHFLKNVTPGSGASTSSANMNTILTTHSPHIASVAPIKALVLLKQDRETHATVAVSTAHALLTHEDIADLQRYIDVTRGELFFARGVIFVEGDAELFLVPAFAKALGIELDLLGISVCSVGGTNFAPYIKLLGPASLDIPHVVLTDLDPVEGARPYARNRILSLLGIVSPEVDLSGASDDAVFLRGREAGFFVNENTLEPVLFEAGLGSRMYEIITTELPNLKNSRKSELNDWANDPSSLDAEVLIRHIERIGKGRFAQLLAPYVDASVCPSYIREALHKVRDYVA